MLALFLLLIVSGFGLFFARPWIQDPTALGGAHLYLALAVLLPYWTYQRAHLRRVTKLSSQLHYKLGLLSMWTFVLSGLSGGWIVAPDPGGIIRLTHLMSSFAFMVLLITHLIVVARLMLSGAGNK